MAIQAAPVGGGRGCPAGGPSRRAGCPIRAAFAKASAIMRCMAYCDLCDMDREFCEHGLADRRRTAGAGVTRLLISPNGIAHFPGCPHKGDHQDYHRWADLETARAWERLGNGEQLPATGGSQPQLTAKVRCGDCDSHGPW